MTYIIYCITNKLNNKKYVGCTKFTAELRFKQHINCANNNSRCLLHKAIKIYGQDNFICKTLLKNIPEEKHQYYEKLWISKLHTYYKEWGYNNTYGGNGVIGYEFSDEAKYKCRKAAEKGALMFSKISPEKEIMRRQRISASQKGKKKDYMWRKHLSESKLRNKHKLCGVNNGFYGKHHTDEVKNIISESNSKSVVMIDCITYKQLKVFKSGKEAAEWLVQNNYCKSYNIASSISQSCKNYKHRKTCGFYWKLEKCND